MNHSPRDEEEEMQEESGGRKMRAEDGLILQGIVGGAVDPEVYYEERGGEDKKVASKPAVNDLLGPRVVKAIDEFSRSVREISSQRCVVG